MIGECLYHKVFRVCHYQINPRLASKVTGMMLEMDYDALLEILESDELVLTKVQEAMHVLVEHLE